MKKRFFTLSNLVLSSLITMLGFGACKSAKSVEKNSDQQNNGDTIIVAPQKPRGEIRVLYGPPPVRKAVPIERKEK